MPNAGTPLSPEYLARLRALVDRDGAARVAVASGASEASVARACAGLPLKPVSARAIERACDAAASARAVDGQ